MRQLKTFESLIDAEECREFEKALREKYELDEDVIDDLCQSNCLPLRTGGVPEYVSSMSTGIAFLYSKYDPEGRNLGRYTYHAPYELSCNEGAIYAFFLDTNEDRYAYDLSGRLLFFGGESDPCQAEVISSSFEKFIQINNAYEWEDYFHLSDSEYDEILDYLGVQPDNHYWSELRSTQINTD